MAHKDCGIYYLALFRSLANLDPKQSLSPLPLVKLEPLL